MPTKLIWGLYLAIHQAIEKSIKNISSPQEADYIAMLINNLPKELSIILNQYIPTLNFRVGGCFIHQKPLAKFCDPTLHKKNPEIGDLLIVYKEASQTITHYNALLLQAKKTNNIYHTIISSEDKHQLLLYTQWPMFEYKRAGNLNGHIRSIHPKTITPGAQYLLIDERHTTPYTFWCAKAEDILVASNTLAHQIINLINFQTGKPFVSRAKGMDHWSQMIWDLLNITEDSCFNRKNAGFHKSPRFSGDIIDLLTVFPHDNQLANNFKEDEKSETQGVSVLAIEGRHENR